MMKLLGKWALAVALLFTLGARFSYATDTPCCGPITPAAEQLSQILDKTDVEHLWLAHQHVNWETGIPDRSADYSGSDMATHCSAFVAAVGKRVGVYVLRPPEHKLSLLANAQASWLASAEAVAAGWRPLENGLQAQQQANLGELVLIVYQSPNPKKPGHIVVVRPSLKTQEILDQEGPQIIQAGTKNHNNWSARQAFQWHPGAWPDGLRYFAHALPQVELSGAVPK